MRNKLCFYEMRTQLTAYMRRYNLVKVEVRIETPTSNILPKKMYFYYTGKYLSFILFLILISLLLNDHSN